MKALGYALLAAGILLLIFGVQAFHSASSGVSRLFTGSPTNNTLMMLVGGAAATIAGVVMVGRD
jgi:hypothetical protein